MEENYDLKQRIEHVGDIAFVSAFIAGATIAVGAVLVASIPFAVHEFLVGNKRFYSSPDDIKIPGRIKKIARKLSPSGRIEIQSISEDSLPFYEVRGIDDERDDILAEISTSLERYNEVCDFETNIPSIRSSYHTSLVFPQAKNVFGTPRSAEITCHDESIRIVDPTERKVEISYGYVGAYRTALSIARKIADGSRIPIKDNSQGRLEFLLN